MPRLTKKTVESIIPGADAILTWDDQLKGFAVEVLPTGKRTYLCKYRVGGGRNGRIGWYTLGSHGAITCEQASDLAVQVLAAVARGEDPQSTRMIERSSPTMQMLWAKYAAHHLPRKKQKSQDGDRKLAQDVVLPVLGRMACKDVSRTDVQRLRGQMRDSPYQANQVLALVSKIMNLAEL